MSTKMNDLWLLLIKGLNKIIRPSSRATRELNQISMFRSANLPLDFAHFLIKCKRATALRIAAAIDLLARVACWTLSLASVTLSPASRARFLLLALILGLTPQALCFRLLRRLTRIQMNRSL